MCEVETTIFAVDGDATQIVSRQHVSPVPGTIDPASHCSLNGVWMTGIEGNVLCKTSFEVWYLFATTIKTIVANRYFSICHRNAVLHRDVVKGLIPAEYWELMTLSKLISQIKRSYAPLLRLPISS